MTAAPIRRQNSEGMSVHHNRPNSDLKCEVPAGFDLTTIRKLMLGEAAAIQTASDCIDDAAVIAAAETAHCRGCVIVTGVGKAGLVGKKLVATLASTGTPAHFLHPCEAVHGDLGRIRDTDIVWALSNSGRSEEVVRIAEMLSSNAAKMISITADKQNPLSDVADVCVTFGHHPEIDPNGLAPTSSTAAMLAVGDAIAIAASMFRGFDATDFAKFHPGGSLGKKLQNAADVMRPIELCRIARTDVSIRAAMTTASPTGRRTGAVMVISDGKLAGIFTDSDLARLLAGRLESVLDDQIDQHMTRDCLRVTAAESYETFTSLMDDRRISELPVVDCDGNVVGMIDRTDLGLTKSPRTDSATIGSAASPATAAVSIKPTYRVISAECETA